jgi:pimeloyl-ACP methyl ester carboxylesterase
MPGNKPIKIYRFPGMGTDCRLYSEISPVDGYTFIDMEWEYIPGIRTLREYAEALSVKIDTSEPFVLMGVSMGGMLCSELTDMLSPLKTLVISSAKHSAEISPYLKKLKHLPFEKIITPFSVKKSITALPMVLGRIDAVHLSVLHDMVLQSDVRFLQFAARAICHWEKSDFNTGKISHIHGSADKVLPVKYIRSAEIIAGGSHLMVWTNACQINAWIKENLQPLI